MAEVARSKIGVATYLAPPGPLRETDAIDVIAETLASCIQANEIQIVLDLSNVSLIGSRFLEVIGDVQDQLTRVGGSLKVVHASDVVTDVFMLTELDNFITLLDGDASPTAHRHRRPKIVERSRLGDVLIARGLASEEEIRTAIDAQSSSGKRLGQLLVENRVVGESDLLQVLADQFALPYVKLRTGLYDVDTVRLLAADAAARLGVVPLFKLRDQLFLATADPQSIPSFDSIEQQLGVKVKPVLACSDEILQTIKDSNAEDHNLSAYIGELGSDSEFELIEQTGVEDYTVIDEMATGSPVINLLNGLIQRAVRDGASDVHIEPSRSHSRIRFRIDGMLYEVMRPPQEVHPALVSRLKVMANLDIAERRLPQDGRIQVSTQGRTIDLRFSSLPGIFGEKVVLRVLDKTQSVMDVETLGMCEQTQTGFIELLKKSYGLLLVTGPTGSGKTTTLYSAINYLNSVEKSIVTIEDPVEYQLDVINQNQVRDGIGLGFAKLLKHVLRQDPDIVMVGEIREKETAEIAVQAALTGHLVLSTLHTNDSAGAISRLLDMGVEPFLLSSALVGVLAQRLIRTVCPNCATTFVAPPGSMSRFDVDDSQGTIRLTRGRGCENCYDSGYRGRAPIHELLVCDASTQQLMVSDPSRDSLATHIQSRDIQTLLDAGITKVLAGQTTVEEVTRVVNG